LYLHIVLIMTAAITIALVTGALAGFASIQKASATAITTTDRSFVNDPTLNFQPSFSPSSIICYICPPGPQVSPVPQGVQGPPGPQGNVGPVNTPTPTTTPNSISTIQGNMPAAAEVSPSNTSTPPPTSSLDCNGAFEKIPLIFRQTTLEKIQDCVTITGKVTHVHYYSPDGDAIVNVYPDPQFLHLMGPANTHTPFVGQYPGPGGIHAEIPCQVAPKLTKPFQGDYCRGDNKALWPHIPVRPKVGDHVKVTGTLATDRNELGGITEIHPVTDIQIIGASGGSGGTGAQTHYQIGYNDGCAGNVVPGPHTSDYKRGYADGQAACSKRSSQTDAVNNGGGSSTSFCDDLNSGRLALAEIVAHALGYRSIDTAARTLCGTSSFSK
jgi:hypothetical protein